MVPRSRKQTLFPRYEDQFEELLQSHKITTKTKYVIDGKEFDSPEQCIQYRENEIEKLLQPIINLSEIPYSKRIQFVQFMLDNRKSLSKLLDY